LYVANLQVNWHCANLFKLRTTIPPCIGDSCNKFNCLGHFKHVYDDDYYSLEPAILVKFIKLILRKIIKTVATF